MNSRGKNILKMKEALSLNQVEVHDYSMGRISVREEPAQQMTQINILKEAISKSDTAERSIILAEKNKEEMSGKNWVVFEELLECALKQCLLNSRPMDQIDLGGLKVIEDLEVITTDGTGILKVNECAKAIFDVFSSITFNNESDGLFYVRSFSIHPVLLSRVPLTGMLLGIPHCALSENDQSLIAFIQEKFPCLDDISIHYQPLSLEEAGHHRIQASVLDLKTHHSRLKINNTFVWNSFQVQIFFSFASEVSTELKFSSGCPAIYSRNWLE